MITKLSIDRSKYRKSKEIFAGHFEPNTSLMVRGPLLKLYVSALPDFPVNSEKKVKIDILEFDSFLEPETGKKITEDPKDDLLAQFEGTIVHEGGIGVYFKDVKPSGSNTFSEQPADNRPWIKLKFDGKTDDSMEEYFIPLLNEDSQIEDDDWFEIGFSLKDESDGEIGNTKKSPSFVSVPRDFVPFEYFSSLELTNGFYAQDSSRYLYNLYTERDNTIVPATGFSEKRLLADVNEKYDQRVKESLKRLKKAVEKSSNVNDIYINKLLEYHDTVAQYYREVETYNNLEDDNRKVSYSSIVDSTKEKADKLKKDFDSYLETNGHIPKSFKETREKLIEAKKRVEKIDDFLNTPVIKVLTILPGGSCVTGFCKILQGKYKEGLIDIGFELLTYGSWNKFKVMAELFENFNKYKNTPMGSLKSLISFRYMKVLQGNNSSVKTLQEIAGMTDPGFGALFKAVNGCKSLKGTGNEFVDLMRNRKLLGKVTVSLKENPMVANADQFILFLKKESDYNNFLLVAGFLKAIKGTADIANNISTAIKELHSISTFTNIVPGADKCSEAANGTKLLLNEINKHRIVINEVLQKIPDHEIKTRQKLEIKKYADENPYADVQFSHSREDLLELVHKTMELFKKEIPRRKEYKNTNANFSLALSTTRHDESLESNVDKLCEIIESLSRISGYDTFNLKSWFYSDNVIFYKGTKNEVPVITGHGLSGIGEIKCKEIIDLVF